MEQRRKDSTVLRRIRCIGLYGKYDPAARRWFGTDFKTTVISIPDGAGIEVIQQKDLPAGWRQRNNYAACQQLGDAWFDKGEALVLQVPSAVPTEEINFVINTAHPDFKTVRLEAVTDLVPDERIEALLKRGGRN